LQEQRVSKLQRDSRRRSMRSDRPIDDRGEKKWKFDLKDWDFHFFSPSSSKNLTRSLLSHSSTEMPKYARRRRKALVHPSFFHYSSSEMCILYARRICGASFASGSADGQLWSRPENAGGWGFAARRSKDSIGPTLFYLAGKSGVLLRCSLALHGVPSIGQPMQHT